MPSHKQVAKRLRQDVHRRLRNRSAKKQMHTLEKQLAVAESAEETESLMRSNISLIDKAAKRHVLHRKTAARKKSRLARAVNKKLAVVAS